MATEQDNIYTSISAIMVKCMDSLWSEAVLEVQLHALAMKISGGYLQGMGSEPSPLKFIKEDKKLLMNVLIELHLQTNLDEKSRWNTMTYHLHTDGQYKVDFSWDQALADDIEKVRAAS